MTIKIQKETRVTRLEADEEGVLHMRRVLYDAYNFVISRHPVAGASVLFDCASLLNDVYPGWEKDSVMPPLVFKGDDGKRRIVVCVTEPARDVFVDDIFGRCPRACFFNRPMEPNMRRCSMDAAYRKKQLGNIYPGPSCPWIEKGVSR